ncbi:hypothetical protein ACQKIE_16085 [Luteibacter sp. NPDC031894]|uniref:Bbp19 family protein n=1 Tax=Luteibacter sp. NPDC031894 TaxID=3390572 RepID=UPI003D07BC32
MRQTEEDRKREQERAERIERAQLKDVKELMQLPAFRRYARRYLTLCNVFETTFTGSSETFFREGKRAVGTTILGEIMKIVPGQFAQMMAERMPDDEPEPEPGSDQ